MPRICIVRQASADVRVRREVGALLDAGHEVDLICLREPGQPRSEREGRLTTRRLRVPDWRAGAAGYVGKYAVFAIAAAAVLLARHLRRRYDLVQVNTLPDTLVFAALGPRLLGVPVLLDLHETMPEFFATKFGRGMDDRLVRLVAGAEQASIRFAHAAITCTEQMREVFVARGARTPIEVILNSSDEAIFDAAHPATRFDGFTVVCHGTLEDRYGLDTLVEAAALLHDELPDLRVRIYGDGPYRARLVELIAERGVGDRVWLAPGWVPFDELVGAIAGADAGVVAMKRDAFRDLTHCNKMFDYIAMGTPAAVSRTRSVELYFDAESFAWFEAGDAQDLARALRELHADREAARRRAAHAAQVAEPYRWVHERHRYVAVVERLLARRRGAPGVSD
jgi:glycosyltransferase involved in cell wall biosynthesis